MTDALLRADPSKISTTLKEGVVDALVNLTFQRISGHGEEGSVVFGVRPRSSFSSAFLLPRPLSLGESDEVTQPIHISAHGLDFQVSRCAEGRIVVTPQLQVYVRVLPTLEDMKRADCVLRFRLNDTTRKHLKDVLFAALNEKWKEIGAGYKRRMDHPEWKKIEAEIRDKVNLDLGLPRDIKTLFLEESSSTDQQSVTDEQSEEGVEVSSAGGPPLNDKYFQPLDIPHKWQRIPLGELPKFVINPQGTKAEVLAQAASSALELNTAIANALTDWASSQDGKDWGFRSGIKVYPSDYKGWAAFLVKIRTSDKPVALPKIEMGWDARITPDWQTQTLASVHISLENRSELPRKNWDETDEAVFQVELQIGLTREVHSPLKLGRVEASYRYNKFLEYPATGFNGGVRLVSPKGADDLLLRTTWAPRYTQPRIVPVSYPSINPNIRDLSTPEGLNGLLPLAKELDGWFNSLPKKVKLDEGLSKGDAEGLLREQAGFARDKVAWSKEIRAINAGLKILEESRAEWQKLGRRGPQSNEKAVLFEAWLSMNETMANLMKEKLSDDTGAWRLFQIAFVVANIPAVASRMKCFRHEYDKERDDTVTLLYFATGGGKSEAFFGLLVLNLFFDRLRGKSTGVTAMLRYPLRLLTIQQAQRCSKVLAKAEQLRLKYEYPGDAFSIGFWVGSGGSPNNHQVAEMDFIPSIEDKPATPNVEDELLENNVNYELQNQAWNKIPFCPFCKSRTALRVFPSQGNLLAHVCTNSKCEVNTRGWTPLPFYICDADIYDLAPSVLLGTVDKLALIGQHPNTLRRIYGMFGAAPWRDKATGRLRVPMDLRHYAAGPAANGCEGLYPAYQDGKRLFLDPFPSLLIQDEAHLLDESLGTFAGLFESALDTIFGELGKPLNELLAYEPDGQTRRRAKVIAASATVSEPQRQLEHLYQRPVPAMQFPFPGQSLYESFYAGPSAPPISETNRVDLKDVDVEQWSKWSRVYVAFLTNGRPHTATTVSVLSNFHTLISELLIGLCSSSSIEKERARSKLIGGLSDGPLVPLYGEKLLAATDSQLATLVDLHRIALTYVTNKKGGDQIMAAEYEETRKRHADRSMEIGDLKTKLISGSVSQGDIQHTIEEAQDRPRPGEPMRPLVEALRSVIATSAISHGVDVDEFNAMFFAGMPSDIAEYIQASSRVGRTHVGFIIMIPTPQRRRDRYIVEVFDSFHRFLERMVQPAAIDRWAGKAIERVLPSFIQAYLTGVRFMQDMTLAAPEKKGEIADFHWIPNVSRVFKKETTQKILVDSVCKFIEKAIGLDSDEFAPGGREHYQELIQNKVYTLMQGWASDDLQSEQTMSTYFKEQPSAMNRPMLSLRDVDEPGDIHFGNKDLNGRGLSTAAARNVMIFMRNGVAEGGDAGDRNER